MPPLLPHDGPTEGPLGFPMLDRQARQLDTLLNALPRSTVVTGGVDMSLFHRAGFILEIGAVTGGGSVTAQLVESNNANMAGTTNLAGNNTSLAGLNTSNKQYTFEARADQISKRYLGLQLTGAGTQNVVVCVVAFGDEAAHKPGNAANDATVVTQNVVS